MASKLFFLVATLCVFQVSLAARVAREEARKDNQLTELSKQTSDFLNNLGAQFNQVVGAKDANELQAILQNNTNVLIGTVQDLAKNLQAQLGTTSGDVSNVVGQVVARLNQTVTELQNQNPEVTAKAKEYQAKLQEGFKTVVAEADKVAKSLAENSKGVQDDLGKLTKKAYDQVLQGAQTFQKQVHEAANRE